MCNAAQDYKVLLVRESVARSRSRVIAVERFCAFVGNVVAHLQINAWQNRHQACRPLHILTSMPRADFAFLSLFQAVAPLRVSLFSSSGVVLARSFVKRVPGVGFDHLAEVQSPPTRAVSRKPAIPRQTVRAFR